MQLARRAILRGATAAIGLSVMPALAWVPLLVGDGKHDDTEALQAFVDGRPFICDEAEFAFVNWAGIRVIQNGRFVLTAPIKATSGSLIWRNSVVYLDCDYMLTADHMNYVEITGNWIHMKSNSFGIRGG